LAFGFFGRNVNGKGGKKKSGRNWNREVFRQRKIWGLGTVPRESDGGEQAGQGLKAHFSEIA